jgi:hypothetical protein
VLQYFIDLCIFANSLYQIPPCHVHNHGFTTKLVGFVSEVTCGCVDKVLSPQTMVKLWATVVLFRSSGDYLLRTLAFSYRGIAYSFQLIRGSISVFNGQE